jgi:hypothetical protein
MADNNFRFWARAQLAAYRGSVAYIETVSLDGTVGCGTCFHLGEGVFVTARHVVEGRTIGSIGFDDINVSQELLRERRFWGKQRNGRVNVLRGPFLHPDPSADVACFQVEPFPKAGIPLGGHLDDWLGEHEFVLYRTLVLGYPPIPLTTEPKLVASTGEVNALVDLHVSRHPHFLISTMARGGFSGGPALVAYNEDDLDRGTALLGIVTQSLTSDAKDPERGFMAVLTVEPIIVCLEAHKMLPQCQRLDSQLNGD